MKERKVKKLVSIKFVFDLPSKRFSFSGQTRKIALMLQCEQCILDLQREEGQTLWLTLFLIPPFLPTPSSLPTPTPTSPTPTSFKGSFMHGRKYTRMRNSEGLASCIHIIRPLHLYTFPAHPLYSSPPPGAVYREGLANLGFTQNGGDWLTINHVMYTSYVATLEILAG